ncbi:MAG: hypothetical protein KAI70_03410 [Candidatus Omnitrophica bacterium]|nr:hypothetical protein [Candidatus Omnitrophota bacterium]
METFTWKENGYDPNKELVTAQKVEEFLKSRNKTRYWFHNLGARHHLLPSPIIKPIMHSERSPGGRKLNTKLPKHAKKTFKKLKGREVFYPKEITKYLELIINLKEENKSFQDIVKDECVQRELCKLKYLVKTDLYTDPVVKVRDCFFNFKASRQIIIDRGILDDDKTMLDYLNQLCKVVEEKWEKYFLLTMQIRHSAKKHEMVDKSLMMEKEKLANSIIFKNRIMEGAIKVVADMLKRKEISWEKYFGLVLKFGEDPKKKRGS